MTVQLVRGTKQYVRSEIAVNDDVVLDSQTVEFSFDKIEWIAGSWIGDPGSVRWAKVEVSADALKMPDNRSTAILYVRITGTLELPWLKCDTVEFK